MTVVMGIIFFLSHQPGDSLYMPSFIPGFDKIAHMGVYALLAGTVLYAFQPELRNGRTVTFLLATVAICLIYGLGDEFHQSFIPGRSVSAADVVADTLGAVGTCIAWYFWVRRKLSAVQISGS
ncbi:MAG: VanZ family protein [Deltaproteobacteria bacterium]|nr:VanZ family protein [Deltaproteobacteria bacterium]MBW2659205.1 VanZ family protein [Deltaproteobacteria bacterium]